VLAERARRVNLLRSWELRRELAQHARQNPDFINLAGGGTSLPIPERVTEAMQRSVVDDGLARAPIRGNPSLRSAIAESYARHNGVTYDPDAEIIVTAGAMHGLFLCIMALIGPGDEAILTRPGFPYDELISYAGGTPVFVDLDQGHAFQLPVDAIADSITRRTKLVTVINPHNPTGRAFVLEELRGLANLAHKHGICILADEVFHKFVFGGRRHITIASLPGMKDHSLVVNSVSKSFAMPGVRVGWIVGASHILAAMEPLIQWNVSCVPIVVQRGAEAAISGPQDWIDTNRRELELRRDTLLEGLLTSPHIRLIPPEGAPFCFPDITRSGLSSMEFAWVLMSEALVGVSPGSTYHGEGHLRIGLGAPVESLMDASRRIACVLNRYSTHGGTTRHSACEAWQPG
jgi:aspartate/methionine/tyrosine aminotransferase